MSGGAVEAGNDSPPQARADGRSLAPWPLPRIGLAAAAAAHLLPGRRGATHQQVLVAVVAVRMVEQTEAGAVLDVDSVVDLTGRMHGEGTNERTVRVASSLIKRLLARGYYQRVPDNIRDLAGLEPGMQTTQVREHGLLGPVRLLREEARR